MIMKELVLNKQETPETLRLAGLPVPVPGPVEIRVKVKASGLNPVDYKVSANGNPFWQYPFVLGIDVAGIIDGLGPDVQGWKMGEGDAVY
jgi:NADPH:quinone reductase